MDDRRPGSLDDALSLVAPGTPLREAIDDLIAAHSGAIIVAGDEDELAHVCSGGFGIDMDFTPQRLFELGKMDGAIVLDARCERILRANVHLIPDPALPTSETGMRHRAAERVSLQTNALVVSISKRREVVHLYRGGRRLRLDPLDVALAKADQALQTLQRYRARLDEDLDHLMALEFEDLVTFSEVATVVGRFEMVTRVAAEVSRHIQALGREGRLIRMQADELRTGVEEEYLTLLLDYAHDDAADPREVRAKLRGLADERVIDAEAVAGALGYPSVAQATDDRLHARGWRVLRRVPLLPATVIGRVVERFGGVPALIGASEDQLDDVDGVGSRRARAIAEGLRRLRREVGV